MYNYTVFIIFIPYLINKNWKNPPLAVILYDLTRVFHGCFRPTNTCASCRVAMLFRRISSATRIFAMPLNDDLQKHIASLAGPEAWEAGLKLFLDNAVLESQHTPKSIIVRLANDRGRFEQVSVAIRTNQLVCRCTCRTPSPYCAHSPLLK